MTKFNRILMALFAIVFVSLTAGCGGSGGVTGPSNNPTPTPSSTDRLVITIEFQDANDNVIPAINGVVQMSASQGGRVCTKVVAPQVPDRMFEGHIDYWPGMPSQVFQLTRNTNFPADGGMWCDGLSSPPKGRHQAVAQFTERGGDILVPEHQTITAQVNFY